MTVQFVEAGDGTRLQMSAEGSGKALVFINGLSTSASYWMPQIHHFRGRARIVTWDFRGHGQSEPARTPEAITLPALVDDLRRVMDAAQVEKATLLGFSLGCEVALEAWRHIPDRIAGIVPVLGVYEHALNHVIHPAVGSKLPTLLKATPDALATTVLKTAVKLTSWPMVVSLLKVTGLVGWGLNRHDMLPYFDDLAHLHAPTYVRMALAAQAHSTADILPTLSAPVLIIAGGKDIFTPLHVSQSMQRLIPKAELFELPEAGHTGTIEFADTISQRIEQFLTQHGLL